MSPGYVLLTALAAFYIGLRLSHTAKDAEIRMLWAMLRELAREDEPSDVERHAAEVAPWQ